MPTPDRDRAPRSLLVRSFATLLLFAAHHVYGAVLYRTPWRHHAAFVAVAFGAAQLALASLHRRRPEARAGRVAGWTLVALTTLVVGGGIGLFEGAYNHILKNALFLAHAPRALLVRLFPPPIYEMPNDVPFEVSGMLQAVAAALAVASTGRFARALVRGAQRPAVAASGRSAGRGSGARLGPGAEVPPRALATVRGHVVRVPAPSAFTHLQLRRFAGCPVCNLHLRSFARRHEELRAAGVREVVVFHSTAEELGPHVDGLPFDVVPDPDKRLYAELGAEASPRALLHPRAWWPIARAVGHALVELLGGSGVPPPLKPTGGRFGLPADFLLASGGRVLASRYGAHVDDGWTVDEVLALAACARRGLDPGAEPTSTGVAAS